MFVTNHARKTIRRIIMHLEYLDMQGRQLHRRRVEAPCEIPPGETRQIDVQTWDRQNTFYYYRTATGRGRTAATPYRVRCRVDTLILIR